MQKKTLSDFYKINRYDYHLQDAMQKVLCPRFIPKDPAYYNALIHLPFPTITWYKDIKHLQTQAGTLPTFGIFTKVYAYEDMENEALFRPRKDCIGIYLLLGKTIADSVIAYGTEPKLHDFVFYNFIGDVYLGNRNFLNSLFLLLSYENYAEVAHTLAEAVDDSIGQLGENWCRIEALDEDWDDPNDYTVP